MPDVRMPDGTIIRNVPEGTTKSELRRRLNAAQQSVPQAGGQDVQFQGTATSQTGQPITPRQQQNVPSFRQVMGRATTESVLNNLMPMVNTTLNQLTPDAAVQAADLATGNQRDLMSTQQNRPFDIQSQDVMGGVQRAGELAAASRQRDFSQFQPDPAQQQQQIQQQQAEQRPGAAMAGNVAGDALTMLGLRTPIAGVSRRVQGKAQQKLANLTQGPLGVKKFLGDRAQSFVDSKLPRGVGRLTDVGLQGATLAMLEDQDPVKAAGWAAGSQATGSLVLSLMKPMVTSKKGLMQSVALGTIGMSIFDQLNPMMQTGLSEEFTTSVSKVLPMAILGTAAGAAGFGRLPKSASDNMPKMTDAITSLQTGAVSGFIQELNEEEERGDPTLRTVIEQFIDDPEFFGNRAMNEIQGALNSENRSVKKTVDRLMNNETFRERFDQLQEQ